MFYNLRIARTCKNLGNYVLFTPSMVSSSPSQLSPGPQPQVESIASAENNDEEENALEQELHEDNGSVTIRRRARHADPTPWKQNIRKLNRNEGQQYLSTSGKIVPARSIKNVGVDCTCTLKCSVKISHDARQDLFKSFWSMSSLQRQRDYLGSMVKTVSIGRKRVKTSKRNVTNHYSFTFNGINHRVCKGFFLSTLDISFTMIKTSLEKFQRSPSTMQSPDKRGLHAPSSKFPLHVIQFVDDHIDKFPRVPAHWCRASSTKEYLEADVNQAKMYELYLDDCETYRIKHPDMAVVGKTTYLNRIAAKNIGFSTFKFIYTYL